MGAFMFSYSQANTRERFFLILAALSAAALPIAIYSLVVLR
jgi:hypothetical protein